MGYFRRIDESRLCSRPSGIKESRATSSQELKRGGGIMRCDTKPEDKAKIDIGSYGERERDETRVCRYLVISTRRDSISGLISGQVSTG